MITRRLNYYCFIVPYRCNCNYVSGNRMEGPNENFVGEQKPLRSEGQGGIKKEGCNTEERRK